MSFRQKRILFATPFYMLFEFFLLKYIFLIFGGVDDIYMFILTVLIGLNHFVPMLFEARKSRRITRFLSTLDGVWMWASLMFLIDIMVIYLIGGFIYVPLWLNIVMLAFVPVLGVYNYWKAHDLVVNEKTLILDNLNHNVRIAHLSDVHFGSVRHKSIISEISDKLNTLDCDLAIISGDLADGSSVVCPDDFAPFRNVKIPIIFSPGNHDFYPGIDSVINACEDAGVTVLDNESVEFKGLNIYGYSYRFDDRECPEIDGFQIRPDMVNIINYHVPYFWEEFCDLGFDIQLSGHTHGGQFYPAVWFGNLIFKYNKGLYRNEDGKYLHVTTGVGSMDTPMRWGTDSEIVILNLEKHDL